MHDCCISLIIIFLLRLFNYPHYTVALAASVAISPASRCSISGFRRALSVSLRPALHTEQLQAVGFDLKQQFWRPLRERDGAAWQAVISV